MNPLVKTPSSRRTLRHGVDWAEERAEDLAEPRTGGKTAKYGNR